MQWDQYISQPALRTLAAALFVVLILSLFGRLLTALMLRLARAFLFTRELSEQLEKPIRALLPLMGLQGVWTSAPDDLLLIDGARHVTTLLIIGTLTWLVMRLLRGLQQFIQLRNPVDVVDNLRARQIQTQSRVLLRTLAFFVLLIGAAAMLMTFPGARQFGASLLASAGLAGLAVGFAARPVLANLIAGTVFLWADYSLPLEPLREELRRLCKDVPELWDGRVCVLQVTDASEKSIQLRALVSSPDSSRNWDLRCHIRENLLGFIQRQYPHSLPQVRADLSVGHKQRVDMSQPQHVEPERQPPV